MRQPSEAETPSRAQITRLRVAVSVLVAAALAVSAHPAQAVDKKIELTRSPVTGNGGRYFVNEPFALKGRLTGTGARHDKSVVLQRKYDGSWHTVNERKRLADGAFVTKKVRVPTVGRTKFRALVLRNGQELDRTSPLKVHIIAAPQPPQWPATASHSLTAENNNGGVFYYTATIIGPAQWTLMIQVYDLARCDDVTHQCASVWGWQSNRITSGTFTLSERFDTGVTAPGTYQVEALLGSVDFRGFPPCTATFTNDPSAPPTQSSCETASSAPLG